MTVFSVHLIYNKTREPFLYENILLLFRPFLVKRWGNTQVSSIHKNLL